MMLDALDRAFLDHWTAGRTAPIPCAVPAEPQALPATATGTPAAPPADGPTNDVLERLLATAWGAWCAVADEVERARQRLGFGRHRAGDRRRPA